MKHWNKCLFFKMKVNDIILWEYLGLFVVADLYNIHISIVLCRQGGGLDKYKYLVWQSVNFLMPAVVGIQHQPS